MLINTVPPSPYDLNFSVLGFPVRVSWTFWLFSAALGYDWARMMDRVYTDVYMEDSPGVFGFLLAWVAMTFVSILVHELGHTFAFRRFGIDSSIELYHMGGLAIPAGFGSWRGARTRRLGPREDLIVSAAGPAAQLALAFIVGLVSVSLGYTTSSDMLYFLKLLRVPMAEVLVRPESPLLYAASYFLVMQSVWWALINLVPVLPLDGGQILKSLIAMFRKTDGLYEAAAVGAVCGILLGIWGMQSGSTFMGIFFLMMGISNIQTLQSRGSGGGW